MGEIKSQRFEDPIKCWVSNDGEDAWLPRYLVEIRDGKFFTNNQKTSNPTLEEIGDNIIAWRQCSLSNPITPNCPHHRMESKSLKRCL